MTKLYVKKLHAEATIPRKGNDDPRNAGYDLYARLDNPITIRSGERKCVPTDISIAIPAGFYGRIAPRSGLAVKNGIDVMAGVIDENYRGHVQVVLINLSTETDDKSVLDIKNGDRIAQLIIEKCEHVDMVEVESLDETLRGKGGWGSTGV